jgi:hypothetical protein
LLTNQFLHIFGWAICVDIDEDGKVKECFPSRVKFRGFAEKNTSAAYEKVSKYMVENASQLYEEAKM